MNNSDYVNPTLCEVQCFTANYSFSTVPYFSLDQPRNITLVYNGDQAAPRPFIFADVTRNSDGGFIPVSYFMMSATVNGSTVTFLNGQSQLYFAGSGGAGPYRLVGQIDGRSYATSIYSLVVTVTATYADGQNVTANQTSQLMIVNEGNSPIAKGWTVAGVQRLYSTTIANTFMITNGDGSATKFAGFGTIAADFTTLTFNSGTAQYTRTYPNSSRVIFNSVGQEISFIDTNGLTYTFWYDGQGRFQEVRDPYRKAPNGEFTGIGLWYGTYGVGGIQGPATDGTKWAGLVSGFVVDSNRCLVSAEDPDHVLTHFTCDANGRLSTITDRKGAVTTLVYDSFTWKLSQTILPSVPIDAGGGSTTSANPVINYSPWQAQGLPTSTTSPSLRWNDPPTSSVVGSVTDPVGRTTSFKPNRFGQGIDITDPLGMHTTLTMSGIRATAITHPNGSTDRYRYDASGRMTMSKPAGKDSTNYAYSGAPGQLSDIWGPGARTEHRDYVQNRLSQITYDVEGTQWVKYYYDPATLRLFQTADNNGHGTSWLFDSQFGNVRQVTDQAGRTTSTTYDSLGRVATVSASGHATQSIGYDILNRVTSRSDGVNPATTITYDALFQSDLQDGNSNVYHTDHNALGWVTAQCEASSCVTARYNSVGEVTSSTNRRGQMVNLTRDALGRVTSKTGGGIVPATFSYSGDQRLIVTSNGIETDSLRLFPGSDTAAPSDTTVIWIKPDSVQAARRYQIVHTGPRSLTGTFVTSISSNTSVTFNARQFHVATNGHLDWINDGFNTTPIGYNTAGLRSTTTYGSSNGVRTETYTSIYSPWSTTFTAPSLDAGFTRSYHYDALARIDKSQSYPTSGVQETSYSYDQLGQLSQAVAKTGCSQPTSTEDWGVSYSCGDTRSVDTYTYDAMGNRTDHGAIPTQWNRYQSFNGSAFTYDLDGNVIQKYKDAANNRNYWWNAENQLDSARKNGIYRDKYEYNALGKPIRLSHADGSNAFVLERYLLWDGDALIAEFTPAGQRQVDYLYLPGTIDHPFAHTLGATAPTSIRYHQVDALGNVIGTSESGSVSQSNSYDPWGNHSIGGNFDSRLFWKGLYWNDSTTGLYYVRSRWYDPEAGRFMSEDPIGHAGGLNLYAFAGNDPINASDPTGTLQFDSHGAVCSIYAECGDPMMIGGLMIGSGGEGGRHLTEAEKKELNDLCKAVDCNQIRVYNTEFSRSFTFGHTIFLGRGDWMSSSALAHEVTHVMQFEKWGMAEYLRQGVNARMDELLGSGGPYAYRGKLNGRSFFGYGMEQQGQMVEDCSSGSKNLACGIIPFSFGAR